MSEVDYAKVVQSLIAGEKKSVMVTLKGKEFPVSSPDPYKYFQLLGEYGRQEIDFSSLAIKSVQLCVPGVETEDDAFQLLVLDGFFEKKDGVLIDAIKQVATDVLSPNEAFEAGQSGEADVNFSPPEASASE